MRCVTILSLMIAISSCSHYKQIEFVVRSTDSSAPVADAKLTAYPEPGGITLTDFIRPQWTYPETPLALTDQAGWAKLKVPLAIPKGVQRYNPDGDRVPKRQWSSSRVLVKKAGFDEQWISKTLPEWKQVTSPIVVELLPE